MKIRSGTDSIDILPVGRYAIGPLRQQHLWLSPDNAGRWGDLSGGRMDITDGERTYLLLRSIENGQDCWYAVGNNKSGVPTSFDREHFKSILEDLLS